MFGLSLTGHEMSKSTEAKVKKIVSYYTCCITHRQEIKKLDLKGLHQK